MKALSSMRCKGQIVVMTALTMIVLIAAVGLAIDSGLGYIIRAKLNAAVDAAAIAAARDVVLGNDETAHTDAATKAARKFFDANYPLSGFLDSTPALPISIGVTYAGGRATINVSATASRHVNLIRVLNALPVPPVPPIDLLTVSSSAQVVRKDLDMVLVMDTTD
jgi:Flp pilus assembly protein TadG